MKPLFNYLMSHKKPSSRRLESYKQHCHPALKLLLALPPILLMWTVTSQKALGQTAITQLNATYQPGTFSTYTIQGVNTLSGNTSPLTYTHNYSQNSPNNNLRLSSFTLSGNEYNLIKLVNQININRVNNSQATGNRQLIFYEQYQQQIPATSTTLNLTPSAVTTMEEALLSDIINRGTDNIFGNQSNVAGNNNNVERVDFVETAGLVALGDLSKIGFLVLERGGNDSFKIAAITAIDAAGKPTAFGNLITVTSSQWGQSTYNIPVAAMRKDPADANLRLTEPVGPQRISTIYFSYQDLGITANQKFYGYALFPPDITSSANLVTLAGFPLDTASNGAGGLDLMPGGGVFAFNLTDLEITKTDNLTTTTPGSNITYTITVKNNGPATVNSLIVNDTPPASLQNVQFTPSTGSYNSSTGDWTGLNLAPNQTVVLTMKATVSASATGTITNTATVSPSPGFVDTNPTNNSSTDTTNLIPTADLEITKTDGLTEITAGSNNTYTITVKNNGPSTVNSLTVLDTPPALLQNVQFTPSTGSYDSSTGNWTGLTLARNQTVVLTMKATVSGSATGTITNTATVSPPSGVVDSNNANNSSTDTTNVIPTADLEITKTDNLTNITPGSNNTYTITVKNNGPSTVNSLTVLDTPPASLQNVQFTPSTGSYNSSTGAWTGLTLAPNQTVVLTMTATVSASATGTITNTATVSPPSGVVDSNPTNNSSTDTTNVVSTYTISGTLYEDLDGEDDFDVGEPRLSANITVRLLNASNNSILSTATTDSNGNYAFNNIPNGSYKVQVDTTDPDISPSLILGTPNNVVVTVSGSNQVVNFGFDKLLANTKPNLLLVKRITALNNGLTTDGGNNLGVYLNDPGNPYDDNTLDTLAPPQQPDTQFWPNPSTFLIGGVNGGNVRPGDELEYTIYFLSTGQATAKNVLMCDRVPDHVTFIPTAFNSSPPQALDGLPKADRGIVLSYNGNLVSLTGVIDGDAGVYFPPGVEPTTVYPKVNCNGSNTNGAVVVNLGDLPFATGSGVPSNSYGFILFRGRVK